jgi:Flp pilus assembly protein TadG
MGDAESGRIVDMLSRLANQLRRFVRGEVGAELIEFALVMPVLVVTVFAIAELGMMYQRNLVITNAAREGARMAILPGFTTTAGGDVEARVNAYLTAAGVPGTATTVVTPVSSTLPSGATITVQQVTVTYSYPGTILGPIIGMIGGSWSALTLRGVASMRVEVASGG